MPDLFERYCDAVCSCVRSVRDHPLITSELTAHLEDRRDAFLRAGFSEEEAEQKAVEAMGNALEVGRALNRAHPIRWTALYMTLFLLFLLCINITIQFGFSAARTYLHRESDWRQPVSTFAVHQSFDLGSITLRVQRAYLYRFKSTPQGMTYAVSLYTDVQSGLLIRPLSNFTGAFYYAAACTDDLGNTYETPRFEGLPRAASVLYIDYDRWGRSFHLEIPLDWGDTP